MVALSAPPSALSDTEMPPGHPQHPDYDAVELAQNCEKPGEDAARSCTVSIKFKRVIISILHRSGESRRGQGVASLSLMPLRSRRATTNHSLRLGLRCGTASGGGGRTLLATSVGANLSRHPGAALS